jgi:hypothetical protein
MPEPLRSTRGKLPWMVGGSIAALVLIAASVLSSSSGVKPQSPAPIVDGPAVVTPAQNTNIFDVPDANAASAATPAASPAADPNGELAQFVQSDSDAKASADAAQAHQAAAAVQQPAPASAPVGVPQASFLFGHWTIQADQSAGCASELTFAATTASNVAMGTTNRFHVTYAPNPKWINVFYDGGLTTYHQYNLVDQDDISDTHCNSYACSTCAFHRG